MLIIYRLPVLGTMGLSGDERDKAPSSMVSSNVLSSEAYFLPVYSMGLFMAYFDCSFHTLEVILSICYMSVVYFSL